MINNGLFGVLGLGAGIIVALAILWMVIWKGFALWISAKEDKKWWFIALLVLNTVGILEIVYIFLFSQTGKGYIAKLRNSNSNKKSEKTEEKVSECDCTTCEGCDCDCHKPIESN